MAWFLITIKSGRFPLDHTHYASQYKSVLCLNGDLPEKSFFSMPLPIIAADGAANQLLELGIVPAIVIGDMDSVKSDALTHLMSFHHEDQDHCDFQKSLWYLEKNNLLPTIIVGIHGGALDHILNNVNLFLSGDNLLYAPPLSGLMIRGGDKRTFCLPLDTKISLLGIPSARLTTAGLRWNVHDDATLTFPGKNACFNRVSDEWVEIQVIEGALLVLIYS